MAIRRAPPLSFTSTLCRLLSLANATGKGILRSVFGPLLFILYIRLVFCHMFRRKLSTEEEVNEYLFCHNFTVSSIIYCAFILQIFEYCSFVWDLLPNVIFNFLCVYYSSCALLSGFARISVRLFLWETVIEWQ